MDEHAVMERRRRAIKKGNKHWRRGKSRKKDRMNNQKAKDVRAGMDTDRAPNFDAIIPVNTAERFPVDARKLHAALGAGRDYATWIQGRINQGGFQISRDFRVFHRTGENGGRPLQDHLLSLDMAKHLAMLERNEMGRKVRDYFIECEKRLHGQLSDEEQAADIAAMPKSAILMLAARQADEIERLEQRNAVLEPKAEALDNLSAGQNLLSLQVAGNELGLGRTTFVKAMKVRAILQHNGQPYRRFLDAGYFEVKPTTIWKGDRQENYAQVFVTQKGLTWLAQRLADLIPKTHQQSLPGVSEQRPMLN